MVDLSPDFGIGCTFNVKNLFSYKGTFDTPSDPFVDEPTLNLFSESPHYLHFLQNYPTRQKIYIISWIIRLSLLETEERDAILLSEKEDLNQKILGLLRRISDSLILTYWSITTSNSSFPTPGNDEGITSLRQFDRVYSRKRHAAFL